ncbi:beta-glucosidase-like glycosyl hydrolase [Nonomuraea polychroma]|uniref:Beta-glucosidase-like glycosyl hydrolase n=1 Tax=Nonomuraea polychroma TaxID=46176 RepID=A0A438LX39_9ACTN|nr:glycoside hydrolase family 3 N-terminal domain-containing protein [Nonomuraea polychroma]RVX38095.1 beta-glucosidase-like glycosyl hydrolase [Nonomuraea polychroma]
MNLPNTMSPVLAGLADTVLQPGFRGTTLPDWVRRRLAAGLGGIALYSRNIGINGQISELTAAIRAENPHVVIALDEEGGDVTRLEAFTGSSRPGNLALGAADDTTLTRAVAEGIGRDLAAAGVTLNYAPVVDLDSDLDNPVVGTRAFGSDPELVARHAAAWVTGLQSAGVAACAKHFPGHGATAVDSHDALPTITCSAAEIAATALIPYRAAIAAGVRAIMTGHLLVPAYDTESPATMSRRLMVDLLRRELGFDGLIVTDGIEMPAVSATYGLGGTAVRALAAGADAICVGGENATPGVVGLLRNSIVAAVTDGTLPEERLAEAAARVRALAEWTTARPGTERAPTTPASPNDKPITLLPTHLPQPAPLPPGPLPPDAQPPGALPSDLPPATALPTEPLPTAPLPTDALTTGPLPTVAAIAGGAGEWAAAVRGREPGTPAHDGAAEPADAVRAPWNGTASADSAPERADAVRVLWDGAAERAVAERALRVTVNRRPGPSGPPHVIELDAPTNLAIDPNTPWGLAAPLSELLPGTTSIRLAEPGTAELAAAADAGTGRALVVVARTGFRHAWLPTALSLLLDRRPDSIVVELGVPGRDHPGAVHVATFSGTALCGRIAAAAIANLISS